jgi:tetratricopeptide (TPR) repeat protein
MPTVHNGCGTWYYGKQRIHRRRSVCEFCKQVGDLESYDTTLYFVLFFVPVLPLSRKRVLDTCPRCSRHRVIPLKDWETSKATDVARFLEKLKQDPDDRETIRSGLALATAYQDPVLLDKLADTLARHRLDDAGIQVQLANSYAYFERHAEAETAFRAALAIDDDPSVRRRLGVTLLRLGQPREALPYLQHILDERLEAEAGTIFLLIEGYQAEGLHQEALELMDRRDAAFPKLAATKEYTKQRQNSERYRDSGKKIRSVYLSASSKAGYREGNWTVNIPRLIAPVLVVGLLCAYLGTAVWMGLTRQVYLVNGTGKPYTVAVNGREQRLMPGAATPVRVAEGEVTVEFRDVKPPLEPIRCRVETPFFIRPFARHTFVLNPDQTAVVVQEDAEYAENPGANGVPPQVFLGKPMHAFHGIDYEFAPFPGSVQVEQGHTVHKSRVSLIPNLTSEVRLRLAAQMLDQAQQREYAQHLLALDPGDTAALTWLLDHLTNEEGLTLLRTRLGDRPILVEWHRAYQTTMEKAQPNEDLRPTYRQLVAETGQQADAIYLLARVLEDDPAEADRLFHQAAAAQPPSAYALYALGYHALELGQFAESARLMTQAVDLAPDSLTLQQGQRTALFAAGQYDTLLDKLRLLQTTQRLNALVGQVQILAVKGDEAQARALLDETVRLASAGNNPAFGRELAQSLEITLCCARHDEARFLELAPQVPSQSQFEPNLLRGKLREAAGLVDQNPEKALVQRGLLYLAGAKAGDQKLAEEQWSLLLAALAKERGARRRLGEMLAGRRPLEVEEARRSAIPPDQKRVLLVVLARRHPATAKELLPLARQLDFLADPTSLCLRKVLK